MELRLSEDLLDLVGVQFIKINYIIGNVNGKDKYIGGLVGFGTSTNYINNYVIGNVRGNDYVGGLVGAWNINSTLYKQLRNRKCKMEIDYVGGLVGAWKCYQLFTNNYATGSLSGNR